LYSLLRKIYIYIYRWLVMAHFCMKCLRWGVKFRLREARRIEETRMRRMRSCVRRPEENEKSQTLIN